MTAKLKQPSTSKPTTKKRELLIIFNNLARHFCPNSKVVYRDYKGYIAGYTVSKIVKGKKIYEIRIPRDVRSLLRKYSGEKDIKSFNKFALQVSILLHEIGHIVLGHIDEKDTYIDRRLRTLERKLAALPNPRKIGKPEYQKLLNKILIAEKRYMDQARPNQAHTDKNNRFARDEDDAEEWSDRKMRYFAKNLEKFKKILYGVEYRRYQHSSFYKL